MVKSELLNLLESVWDKQIAFTYNLVQGISDEIGIRSTFLEIGCGSLGLLNRRGDLLSDLYNNSIGLDVDRQALSNNKQIRYPVCGDCNHLPLRTSSVDIIVCVWLFEHLRSPSPAMAEFARVLRKGGYLLTITPNLLNYAVLLSRLTPTTFHNMVRRAGGEEENTPAYYRANTKKKLFKLAEESGFVVKTMNLVPYSFMYYKFSKRLFVLMKQLGEMI